MPESESQKRARRDESFYRELLAELPTSGLTLKALALSRSMYESGHPMGDFAGARVADRGGGAAQFACPSHSARRAVAQAQGVSSAMRLWGVVDRRPSTSSM